MVSFWPWPFKRYRSWRYDALDNRGSSINAEKSTVNEDRIQPIRSYTIEMLLGSLVFSNLVFAALCGHLFLSKLREAPPSENNGLGSFEHGFMTDLAAIRSHIKIGPRLFTGGAGFTADGTEYLKFPPDEPRYIGEPTQEIDDAWSALTAARYIFVTEEEAREAWGPNYEEFWDPTYKGYIAGLDTFHLLHCLDHIRQAFYPERYIHEGIHGTLHRDHCIDSLRQMLQCTSDLTPIPTRFYPGIGHSYIDSDRVHTCRDFSQIRAWLTDRFNGSSAVRVRVDHERQGT